MPSAFWRASGRALRWPVLGFVGITGVAGSILWLTIPVRPVPINVRWTADVTPSQRAALEQRFHLTAAQQVEGLTWSYLLTDASTANIRAMVQDNDVDDTEHIVRARFRPWFAYDRPRRIAVFAVGIGGVSAILIALVNAVSLFRSQSTVWPFRIQIDVTEGSLAAITAAPPLLLVAASAAVLLMAAVGWQPLWQDAAPVSLSAAAAAADRVLVSRMLGEGSDPNATGPVVLEHHPDSELTPLEAAVVSRDLATVMLLVKAGSRVDAGNRVRLVCLAMDVGARDVAEYLDEDGDHHITSERCAGVDLPTH